MQAFASEESYFSKREREELTEARMSGYGYH
jgi:hypothetical protein